MALKSDQKMILLSHYKLHKLTQKWPAGGVREMSASDFDLKMSEILKNGKLDQYEIFFFLNTTLCYSVIFVSSNKEYIKCNGDGDCDASLEEEKRSHGSEEEGDKGVGEEALGCIKATLVNQLVHDCKKVEYVLKKYSEMQDGWVEKRELVYNGRIVKGYHMTDLVKNFTASYKMYDFSPPRGWNEFLSISSELTLQLSRACSPGTDSACLCISSLPPGELTCLSSPTTCSASALSLACFLITDPSDSPTIHSPLALLRHPPVTDSPTARSPAASLLHQPVSSLLTHPPVIDSPPAHSSMAPPLHRPAFLVLT